MKRDFWYRSVGNFFIKIVWIYIRFILTNISCQVFSSVLFILFLNVCASITILDSFYVSQDNELTKFSPTSLSSSILVFLSSQLVSHLLREYAPPSIRWILLFLPVSDLLCERKRDCDALSVDVHRSRDHVSCLAHLDFLYFNLTILARIMTKYNRTRWCIRDVPSREHLQMLRVARLPDPLRPRLSTSDIVPTDSLFEYFDQEIAHVFQRGNGRRNADKRAKRLNLARMTFLKTITSWTDSDTSRHDWTETWSSNLL